MLLTNNKISIIIDYIKIINKFFAVKFPGVSNYGKGLNETILFILF